MNIRKITSMTLVWSLIILILNSLVLYVVPEGRVAYWADWRFLGLTKSQWGDQHTTIGFLFLVAGILHIYYNWKPIAAYMKNKAKELKVFTLPSNVGLVLTLLVIVGTYFNVPPLSTVLHISDGFKQAAAHKYGEPPYGHAELSSLKNFSRKENLDVHKALELLAGAGMKVKGQEAIIKDIANENDRSPQEIYNIIKAAGREQEAAVNDGIKGFPDAPKPGWGKMKLSVVCETYGLEIKAIIDGFAANGIKAGADNTIKEIAMANDMEPINIFEVLRQIVVNQQQKQQ